MNDRILITQGSLNKGTTVADYGTDWLCLLVPLGVVITVSVALVVAGDSHGGGFVRRLFDRAGSSLEKITGLPPWCAAGLGLGLAALLIAVVGWLWDVSWHIALGRDKFLFTPAHMMIVVGLALIAVAGLISIIFATIDDKRPGLRMGGLSIPYGGLALVVLGQGALTGFPLDEFWHRAYGIDVTMWGPTHLVMIAGASFTPLALWLLLAEADPDRARSLLAAPLRALLATAALLGLSTFPGEFDFGVPQFQQLYHPVLVAVAAAAGLTLARAILGRGGALKAAVGFLLVRGLLALLIGPVLNLAVPRFPLYLGAAVVVEIVWGRVRRLSLIGGAAVMGLAVGIAGLATEWGWTHLWGHHAWGPGLFPGALIAVGAAIPAAMLGTAMGEILSFRRSALPATALALAGLVLVAFLGIPLPRAGAPVEAEITTRSAGTGRVEATVRLQPPAAAEGADWFEVLSWQGGSLEITPLRKISGGVYETAGTVPVNGNWKSIVRLARKDVLVAAPIYMPADEEIGASEVPVRPRKEVEFRPDRELLLREASAGPTWPAIVAYLAILVLVLAWVATFVFGFGSLHRPGLRSPPARKAMATPPSEERTAATAAR